MNGWTLHLSLWVPPHKTLTWEFHPFPFTVSFLSPAKCVAIMLGMKAGIKFWGQREVTKGTVGMPKVSLFLPQRYRRWRQLGKELGVLGIARCFLEYIKEWLVQDFENIDFLKLKWSKKDYLLKIFPSLTLILIVKFLDDLDPISNLIQEVSLGFNKQNIKLTLEPF